jgi:methylenetetrahydrofolate dehydrogenase (NADP+)/methenyltetrahydrofolate cyclohydrolase
MPGRTPERDLAMAEAVALLGKPIAERIRSRIQAETPPGLRPCLAVVVASDDAAVARYAAAKQRTADALGLGFRVETVDPAGGQASLDARIAALSADSGVHGILLELPLAAGLDVEVAIRQLDPLKDVDGLTPHNLGLIAAGREADALLPATPAACIQLAATAADLRGARAVVVGRGRAVGRALAPMLVNRDATVTVCHSRTRDLAAAVAAADIVFVAAGRPDLVGGAMVRPGQVVVDAGISVVDGRVVGDVDADNVRSVVAALTPVPGGVGPLTATLIFSNLL